MLKNIVISIVSFLLGAFSVVLFAVSMSSENDDVSLLETRAYLDDSVCPNFPSERLVGTWKGKKDLGNGESQEWIVERKADGTYDIRFKIETSFGITTSEESGLWGFSNCLYTVVTKMVDGHSVIYQEAYRVHEVNDQEMVYTRFESGETYTVYRND